MPAFPFSCPKMAQPVAFEAPSLDNLFPLATYYAARNPDPPNGTISDLSPLTFVEQSFIPETSSSFGSFCVFEPGSFAADTDRNKYTLEWKDITAFRAWLLLFPSHSRPYTPPTFPPVSSVAPVSPSRPRPSFDSLMGFPSARPGQREVIELDDDRDISLVCHFNENGELVARSRRRILPLLTIPDPIPSSFASSPASSLPSSSSVASLFSEAGSTSSASSIDDQDTHQKTVMIIISQLALNNLFQYIMDLTSFLL
ncbi:hypothetical protein C8J56DRAFT_1131879 [Mycena floridula]|nr:hypothetical protein C8J56DRAFT_1131879 [Mycena floridula]